MTNYSRDGAPGPESLKSEEGIGGGPWSERRTLPGGDAETETRPPDGL